MEPQAAAFTLKATADTWEPDPDVGGQMKILYRGEGIEAGLSRFTEPLPEPIRWTLPATETFYVLEGSARIEIAGAPALEVAAGDMGCIPAGARTTWHLTTPFLDFYVLS